MKIFEKKLFITKYFALAIGLITAFLQPNFFNRFFSQDEFALLILMFGLSTYLIFFDGGISKPIYPILRQKFVDQEDIGLMLFKMINFYNIIFIVVMGIFLSVILLIAHFYTSNFSSLFFILFSFYISLNLIINYYKNIFNAVDLYLKFEYIDLIRKVLNVLLLLFLYIDSTFIFSFLFGSIVTIGIYIYILSILTGYSKISLTKAFRLNIPLFIEIFSQYFHDSYQYVQFSINEMLIYNSGFMLIPIFLSSFDVIQYGLWMRLFIGMSIFIRALSDISIHAITKYYFSKQIKIVQRMMIKLFILSSIMMLVLISIYLIFVDKIFMLWVNDSYRFDIYLNIALIILILSNTYQHIAGTLLIAIGDHFSILKKISFFLLISIIFSQLSILILIKSLSIALMITSIIYFVGMLIYLYLLRNKIW